MEAAADAPSVDARLELEGDAQGVARVREALEAHMWPGLVRKARPAAAAAAALAAADGLREAASVLRAERCAAGVPPKTV